MERIKRAVSLILCFVMVFGLLPMHAFAATADDSLTAALTEATNYINGITVNSQANDPSKVVSQWGTHFTWDNEKRDNAKTAILYEWSYYNGVVFEGLEYLYEVTKNEQYKDYVIEYLSSMIQENGTWYPAPSADAQINNIAGYTSTYGADCYKTASLLLDAYEMTGDDRYLTMAETLYNDLDLAAETYLLDEAGNNYRHTWESDPTPDLWLDGLYMILPFRAEYAKYSSGQNELDQIVSRLQWVSNNMYNSTEKLFYHAADSASSNSGTYWLRSIGWYAAAIVDVMDSMEGSNLETMKAQLVKLVDGMKPHQRESGLWSNAVTGTVNNDANREETSGTALLAYAILKAVNNGWLDESYADMAIKAFKGICENKLEGTDLKDICYIGEPGSSNAEFKVNEGKGVGPFIMLTAEVQEYVNNLEPAAGTGSVTGNGNLKGGNVYTLDTDGVTANKNYLIVSGNSGNVSALTNNGSTTPGSTTVQVSGNTITVEDDSKIAWQFSNTTSGSVGNNGRYVYPNNGSLSLNTNGTNLTISDEDNGEYLIYRTDNYSRKYYLRYNSGWTGTRVSSYYSTTYSVYLYELTSSSAGEAVTFTVTPGSATIAPKGTVALTGTVTVGGKKVDLGDCTITWASSDTTKATVSNGVVTGVADGTANITATLTAVNGKAVANNGITVSIPVTVSSKKVDHYVLTGNDPINVNLNETPDFSNIKYLAVYEDNSTAELPITFGECDTSTSGRKTVDILYNGTKVGEVVVNVTVDFSKLPEADMSKAPEYPNNGAVRIDKFATHTAEEFKRTGVTRVELDVAGITVKQGVDVVLVVDISNSMGWSLENAGNSSDGDRIADDGQITKLQHAMKAASDFADALLAGNNGTTADNTLSFVTFAGFADEFGRDDQDLNTKPVVDSLMEVFRQVNNAAAAKISFEGTRFTDNTSSYPIQVMDEEGNILVRGNNRGDTNYDYAFWQAMQTVNAIKADNISNNQGTREVYIIFMTDGAPSHYNHNNKSGSGSRDDLWPTKEGSYKVANSYTSSKDTWYNYFCGNANTYAKTLYDAVNGNFYAIGFDLAHGGYSVGGTTWQWTEAELVKVLEGVAYHNDPARKIPVTATADAEHLAKIYAELALKFRPAGTEAVVTDIVDQNFSVQMENNVYDKNGNPIALNTPPSITIKTYDLYPRGSVDANGKDITGKRTGTSADIETVTFANVNGKLEAYSSVIGSRVNILTTDAEGNITISAKYFTYTKEAATSAEKFVWTIGEITDKEIALAFDAYLEGSMQGLRPQDVYYTNEEAVLEYVDINGKYAKKIFPIPGVAWGGASTTIRFYLVDHQGNPVNRDGDIIPWENRIYVGDPVVVPLNLNADLTIDAQRIEAAAHVPAQFFLYDINAYYTVQTTSSAEAITPGITVSDPSEDAFKVTGTGDDVRTQTGAQTTRVISAEEEYYTWSYVGFGVRWDLTSEKAEHPLTSDQIVIDYGKAIQVDVLANDANRNEYNRKLVGFVKYTPGTDLNYVMKNPGSATFTAEYGNFSIDNGKVQFQPTKMINKVQRVFYAVEYTQKTNTENKYIVWGQLDIIPATIMYYETDFAAGIFTTNNTWSTKSAGDAADGPQDDGTIGKNTYGFDSSYDDDDQLSNGSSLFAEGQGVDTTTVTFSFTGTGFDLISRTGELQGLINAQIATDAGMTNVVKSVSVLNKSETKLELYQIPVLSVNNLTHGTYYVKIGVEKAYNSTAIPMLNRGGEFYFDAIRIYDPVKGDSTAQAAYNADGEANNVLDEVREKLISAETFNALTNSTDGVVFIDRTYTEGGIDLGVGNVKVSNYAAFGPNNEVYLSNGQAVTFHVQASSIPASFDIGAKSIRGSTAGLQVTIRNADGSKFWTVTKEIKSSTVQFIDLLKATGADASLLNQGAYVVITNTGDGVLSITDIKTAFRVADTAEVDTASVQDPYGLSLMTANAADPYAVSFTVDANTLNVARSVLENPVEPEEPEEPTEPSEPEVDPSVYNIISASVKKNGSKQNVKYTITVVTTMEVEKITVSQGSYELKPSKISFKDKKKNGTREWTIILTAQVSDLYEYFTLVGAGDEGITGDTFNVTKPR